MRAIIHTRIIQHPFAALMQGALLDSFEQIGNDLTLGVRGLQIISSELFNSEGKIFERIICKHVPLRLTFSKVTEFKISDFFRSLENHPINDPSRIIAVLYSWRQSEMKDIFYLFGLHTTTDADIRFFAQRMTFKIGKGGSSFTFERDYSPSPPMPDRLVPEPKHIHRQFGGDPIRIKFNSKIHRRKLFIGGVHIQPYHHPYVDAVLNVGEEPSNWAKRQLGSPSDRWDNKGEGSDGMSPEVIREEAEWVIEHLQKNQRVLVHCAAGMNRSTTICCAVLMLMEKLSAEDALKRVREHHPWAKPDSHHWLMLRWLEKNKKE